MQRTSGSAALRGCPENVQLANKLGRFEPLRWTMSGQDYNSAIIRLVVDQQTVALRAMRRAAVHLGSSE